VKNSTKTIRRTSVDVENLNIDESLLNKIHLDMSRYDKTFTPDECWKLSNLFPDNTNQRSKPKFDMMLAPWVGKSNIRKPDPALLADYLQYINSISKLSLLNGLKKQGLFTEDNLIDLNTIIDIELIYSFLPDLHERSLTVLEVGGGYGRLCEGMFNVFGDKLKYVLVDAVPASIYYSYLYLKKSLPGINIGFYYQDDRPDLEKYDCYIVPSWHFENCFSNNFDLCLNLSSLQEMNDDQVNYYLNLFNHRTKLGGRIVLFNSRDYIKSRDFIYPKNWLYLFKQKTPRSRTIDMPLDILENTKRDCTSENAAVIIDYHSEILNEYRNRLESIKSRQKDLKSALERIREKRKEETFRLRENRNYYRNRLDQEKKITSRIRENRDYYRNRLDQEKKITSRIRENRDYYRDRHVHELEEINRIRKNRDYYKKRFFQIKEELNRIRSEKI